MQRQNRSEFAAGYGLPLVGPQLLIQEPESQRAALNSRPKLKPQTPPALAYCGQKMVLTMGSTLAIAEMHVVGDQQASLGSGSRSV